MVMVMISFVKALDYSIGSFLPGFNRTSLIAGHSLPYFECLGDVNVGDIIKISTHYGDFEYKITDTKIGKATDESNYDLAQSEKEQLILYTCYPFELIGYKADRLFVYADKISGPTILEGHNMARKKSSSRTTLSYILSLLIAIFLSILVVLTVTRFTVMSPSFLISKMDGADFYKQSVVSLNEEIQQETQSTGFPIEMFENYVDEDTAKTAMEKYINNAFDGGETTINTTEFETKLTQDIDNYLTTNNIIINSESQEAISVLKSNLIDLYKSYLSFPYLALVIDVINTYDGIFLIAAAALVVLIGLASFLLYRLYSHYQGRRRYFSYAYRLLV